MLRLDIKKESHEWPYSALDRRKEDLLAVPFSTNSGRSCLCSACHHRALVGQVRIHSDIWIFAYRYSNGRVTQRTFKQKKPFNQPNLMRKCDAAYNLVQPGCALIRHTLGIDGHQP